jgi:hypothetical protein
MQRGVWVRFGQTVASQEGDQSERSSFTAQLLQSAHALGGVLGQPAPIVLCSGRPRPSVEEFEEYHLGERRSVFGVSLKDSVRQRQYDLARSSGGVFGCTSNECHRE